MEEPALNPIQVPPVVAEGTVLTYATPQTLQVPAEWTNTETYLLNLEKQWKYIAIVAALNCLISLIIGTLMVSMVMWQAPRVGVQYLLVFVTIFAAMQLFGMVRMAFRVRRQWPTYRLVIGDQGFVRTSEGSPMTRVDAHQVTRIRDSWDGVKVFVAGGRYVTLSKWVENWPGLHARLMAWQPIDANRGKVRLVGEIVLAWGLTLVNIALFYYANFSWDRSVVLKCAIATTVILGLRMWMVSRQKGVPRRTWIALLISILLPMVLFLRYMVGMPGI